MKKSATHCVIFLNTLFFVYISHGFPGDTTLGGAGVPPSYDEVMGNSQTSSSHTFSRTPQIAAQTGACETEFPVEGRAPITLLQPPGVIESQPTRVMCCYVSCAGERRCCEEDACKKCQRTSLCLASPVLLPAAYGTGLIVGAAVSGPFLVYECCAEGDGLDFIACCCSPCICCCATPIGACIFSWILSKTFVVGICSDESADKGPLEQMKDRLKELNREWCRS